MLIEKIAVSIYTVPTETPESDGTLEWAATTMVLVEARADKKVGIGFSYADLATGQLIKSLLAKVVEGRSAYDINGAHAAMVHRIRNLGRPGIASMAISAVDNALWDLKAKLLDCSLLDLLGAVRESVEIYGSGGFTSYTLKQLQDQLGGWAAEGFHSVKMKVGRFPLEDINRVKVARKAVGSKVRLFVDGNGAYSRKQALVLAQKFAEFDVTWFEEPVPSDDLGGLHFLRERLPAGMRVAAGEYGFDPLYFHRMLTAEAVDVLQADATRCGGLSGFLEASTLCRTFGSSFSFHCAPSIHATPACAVPSFMIGEYFFDHARIEQMFFDGVLFPKNGTLKPDRSRPGFGLDFKRQDAAPFAV